ncbi:alkene reductase [Micromonospora musae]|uniref:alkene reductase n=1 Tax=Micromonospora musae TaxID=1894970 RepID=UPI00343B0815
MDIFSPATFGSVHLENRIVLAPMTRLRAHADGSPSLDMATYYAQRASFGLIVTEGVFPSLEGRAYLNQPGIATKRHAQGWRRVTDAVHDRGGSIFMQIMHAGMATHSAVTGGSRPVGPSATSAKGLARTQGGKVAMQAARSLSEDELRGIAALFAEAAERAVSAGFDGVEVQGANGYLLHQFFAPNTNNRSDRYGGSPVNRACLAVEIVSAVSSAIGAERTALRISPRHHSHGINEYNDDATNETYHAVVSGIAPLNIAYLSYLPEVTSPFAQKLRELFGGPFVVNTGPRTETTYHEADRLVSGGFADAVAVGRVGLANPDLVRRWRHGLALNRPRMQHFYVGGANGYTDYPELAS